MDAAMVSLSAFINAAILLLLLPLVLLAATVVEHGNHLHSLSGSRDTKLPSGHLMLPSSHLSVVSL